MLFLKTNPKTLITGAPAGYDAKILLALAENSAAGEAIYVASDEASALSMLEALQFFAPEAERLYFPPWDCLPYDRVSPHQDVVAERLTVLSQLLKPSGSFRIVVTTAAAMAQYLPPPQFIAAHGCSLRSGDKESPEKLKHMLQQQGYYRTDLVREEGEFAARGSLLDIFPPGSEHPLRIDFFGDHIESIRYFDPISQRSTDKADGFHLLPMAELVLDEASISRFRQGYRRHFGAVAGCDPLYDAISEGRRQPGMEHWLPLFHEKLCSLADYLPEAVLVLHHQAEAAHTARQAQVEDFYNARQEMKDQAKAKRQESATPYNPLPPALLYMDKKELEAQWQHRQQAVLSALPMLLEGYYHIEETGRRGRNFTEQRNQGQLMPALAAYLQHHQQQARLIACPLLIACHSEGSRQRLQHLLAAEGITLAVVNNYTELTSLAKGVVGMAVLALDQGFEAENLIMLTEQDIFGDRLSSPARKRKKTAQMMELGSLEPGELVVHREHGIGRFEGLETLTISGAAHDCLRLIYDGGDKLFLPVENIEVIHRYGPVQEGVALDKLGGANWQARKSRITKKLKDMADALIAMAAARILKKAEELAIPEAMYQEFTLRFPYTETDDQLKAIDDVLDDMKAGRPMDRLVCGDVGFGKTEVALRAAFVAVMSGQQVAIIAPTTLLCRQHYQTFTERYRGLPVRIGQISRLVTAGDAKKQREQLQEGTLDIVVGTHALLSAATKFQRLGLVVVDEEQRFGVKQKEKLKELADGVHVLTLTATPIPRTLQMALSGVRELSLITTAPMDRLPVRSFALPYDGVIIREALMREHFRGGQIFYVCPRLEDLPKLEERLANLVPELKVITAHGQLAAAILEERMAAFYEGQYDILLATNIVESGLDIPRANTIILHRADLFGLAQLYQLRGRVGRSRQRGYAYFTWSGDKPLTASAAKRLEVITGLDSLGAGFQLASHDLDMRGSGNLLGEEQSGQVREVGVELYQKMLEEAVAIAKQGGDSSISLTEEWSPTIQLGLPVLIPEHYVPDLPLRLSLYRRLASLTEESEIETFAVELVDRFGTLPPEADSLLALMNIKRFCRLANIDRLDAGNKGAVIAFRHHKMGNVEALLRFVQANARHCKIRPDQKMVYMGTWDNPEVRLKGVLALVTDLAKLGEKAKPIVKKSVLWG
ncbi:MAG: transcription-repair coupling factor [Alphaproteobacteria bacterium]